ncbi:MAG: DNA-methyltransferase [Dehalococcoidia bacterium]
MRADPKGQPYLASFTPVAALDPAVAATCALLIGDARACLRTLPAASVQTCVTSPPYWGLRDYALPRHQQIGAEDDLGSYLEAIVEVFAEVHRVLRDDGTLWLNLGDSYTSGNRTWRAPDKKNPARTMEYRPPTPEGLKPKDLIGVPWRVAFALQAAGWYLRSDIIWYKPNCQPESVKDRPTQAHEYLFLLTKSERYFYDAAAVREPTKDGRGYRNRRTVWEIPTDPFPEAHFATFPPALVQPCIAASTRPGDLVLDPFLGSGTVGRVALEMGRPFVGIEIREEYAAISARRTGVAPVRVG